jgi:hypothetical protein
MLQRFLLSLACAAALAACGSTTISGSGGQTTTTGAGGCLEPTEGDACSTSDVACQPADLCCAGYEWTCTNGAWWKAGLGCACIPDTFACGKVLCTAGEICVDRPPGVAFPDGGTPPPDAYLSCEPAPAACTGLPTCACAADSRPATDPCSTKIAGVTCADDGAGHVTLQCMGQ